MLMAAFNVGDRLRWRKISALYRQGSCQLELAAVLGVRRRPPHGSCKQRARGYLVGAG